MRAHRYSSLLAPHLLHYGPFHRLSHSLGLKWRQQDRLGGLLVHVILGADRDGAQHRAPRQFDCLAANYLVSSHERRLTDDCLDCNSDRTDLFLSPSLPPFDSDII